MMMLMIQTKIPGIVVEDPYDDPVEVVVILHRDSIPTSGNMVNGGYTKNL